MPSTSSPPPGDSRFEFSGHSHDLSLRRSAFPLLASFQLVFDNQHPQKRWRSVSPSHSRIFLTGSWSCESLLAVFSLRSTSLLALNRALAAAGGVLNYINGFHRPFSLTDASIAFPSKPDIVSIPVVVVVAMVIPAAIIAVLNLGAVFLLHERTEKDRFRRMLWEIHVGLLGLCAGLAITLFVTSALKDMVGKPRPKLLARCQADLSNVSQYVVGSFGNSLNSEAGSLVTSAICKQANKRFLDDSFAAFPSGHSSFSSAGLVYLSLWLCARFSLGIPYLDLLMMEPLHNRMAHEG